MLFLLILLLGVALSIWLTLVKTGFKTKVAPVCVYAEAKVRSRRRE